MSRNNSDEHIFLMALPHKLISVISCICQIRDNRVVLLTYEPLQSPPLSIHPSLFVSTYSSRRYAFDVSLSVSILIHPFCTVARLYQVDRGLGTLPHGDSWTRTQSMPDPSCSRQQRRDDSHSTHNGVWDPDSCQLA